MIDHKEIEKYILSFNGARLDYPFGESTAVYKIGESQDAKMFALIAENTKPIRLSLKCDPNLSEVLQAQYETVLPGFHLNKKNWITIICTGQLPYEDIKSLIINSYKLVSGEKTN